MNHESQVVGPRSWVLVSRFWTLGHKFRVVGYRIRVLTTFTKFCVCGRCYEVYYRYYKVWQKLLAWQLSQSVSIMTKWDVKTLLLCVLVFSWSFRCWTMPSSITLPKVLFFFIKFLHNQNKQKNQKYERKTKLHPSFTVVKYAALNK